MTDQRKLAAVMFTDIAGYTALMSKDEQKAMVLLQKNRDMQKSLAKKHRGEFLKEMGDGTLLCFQSALDAVRCAMEIQKTVKDDPDLNLRIGIHLGDIVFKDGDVFGDGVNVASRIEALAEANRICISEEVYRNIRNQSGINTEFIGEKQLRNFDHPIKLYMVIGERLPGEKSGSPSNQMDSGKKSIAVLPFVDMSPHKDQEYFSDGLTEELINALTQLKDLRVVARTSSFTFKGREIDIREIGNRLNVQKVLEGSVRKAGNHIRITAQLINIEDGYHEWSERYDRDLEDVFAIQDEISREIANKFKTRFREKRKPQDIIATQDLGAYELYLKGRYYFNKFSPEWINKAIDSFSEAITIDPDFALAYAGLAEAYIFLSTPLGVLESTVAMPKAKTAAERALKLNSSLPEAYVSLGAIATFYDWDREKAHLYFRRAIELNPNNAIVRLWYEMALSILDQNYDEALAQLTVAFNLDPLNLLVRLRMGYIYCYKYDFDTAIQYFNQIINIEPSYATGYHGLLDAYGMKGEYALATIEGEKAVELSNYPPPFVGVLGLYCARGEEQKRAEELLSMLLERSETEPVSPFWIGVIYMGLNELDHMFEWFEKAYEQRDGNLLYLFAPPFDSIREDKRFIKLRQKMGLEN